MTTNRNGKELAARINRLVDFIDLKSGSNFPRFLILNLLLVFGRVYDLYALLCYFEWAQDTHQHDADILKTIMHDLNGIKHNPETFRPHTAGYSEDFFDASE
jgi:hypothetical protein